MSRNEHFAAGHQMVPTHVVAAWGGGDAYDEHTEAPKPAAEVAYRKRRDPGYPALRDSIAKEGIREPLFASSFARPHAVLDDGHHRLAAALELGLSHVPVKTGWLSDHDLQPSKVEYRYVGQRETGGKFSPHAVEAHHPVYGKIGHLEWTAKGGIHDLKVDYGHRRQGHATALWEAAHRAAGTSGRIPTPKHSTQRTNDGDAWARTVGGSLPRRDRR